MRGRSLVARSLGLLVLFAAPWLPLALPREFGARQFGARQFGRKQCGRRHFRTGECRPTAARERKCDLLPGVSLPTGQARGGSGERKGGIRKDEGPAGFSRSAGTATVRDPGEELTAILLLRTTHSLTLGARIRAPSVSEWVYEIGRA